MAVAVYGRLAGVRMNGEKLKEARLTTEDIDSTLDEAIYFMGGKPAPPRMGRLEWCSYVAGALGRAVEAAVAGDGDAYEIYMARVAAVALHGRKFAARRP